MHTLKRKTTALLLVFAMLFSLLPAFPQTAEATTQNVTSDNGLFSVDYDWGERTVNVEVKDTSGNLLDKAVLHNYLANSAGINFRLNDKSYQIVSVETSDNLSVKEMPMYSDRHQYRFSASLSAASGPGFLTVTVEPYDGPEVSEIIYNDIATRQYRLFEDQIHKMIYKYGDDKNVDVDTKIKSITPSWNSSFGDNLTGAGAPLLDTDRPEMDGYFYKGYTFNAAKDEKLSSVQPYNMKDLVIVYSGSDGVEKTITVPSSDLRFSVAGEASSKYYNIELADDSFHTVYFYNQDGAFVHYSAYAVRFVEDGASLGENMPADPDYGSGNAYIFVNWEIEDTGEPFFSNTIVTEDLSVYAQKVSSPGSGGTQIHADNTDNELIARIVEVYNAEHGTAITAQDVDKNSITMSVSETDGTTTNREYYNNKWFTYDGDEYYRMWNLDVPIGLPTLKNDHVAYDDISTLNVFFNLNDGSEEQSISLPIGENAGEISKSMVDADTIIRLAVIDAPTAPTAPDLEDDPSDPDDAYILGDGSVKVDCIEDETHKDGSYALLSGSYDVGNVYWKGSYKDGNGAYYVDVTVNNDAYVTKYNETSEGHTISGDKSQTITLKWENDAWKVETQLPVVFTVTCDGGAAADGITLKYDANGGTFANGKDEVWASDLQAGTYKLWEGDAIPDGFDLPTHDQVDGKDVVLIGWTKKADDKIYTKDDEAPTTLTEITLEQADKKVYAVWGYDENGNGKPDVTEETYTLTYDANGGAFGKPGGESQAVVNDLLADTYKLWAKDDSGTQPDGEKEWPMWYQSQGIDVVMIGWTAEEDNKIYGKGDKMPALINEVTIKDKDVTVYAVWGYDENGNGKPDVEEDTYTLTYDATLGAFGKPGGKTQATVKDLTADTYKLWVKDPEVTDDVQPENEAKWPAFYNVSGDNNVVMIGWTAEEDDKIYKKGDKMPALIDEVTIKDKDVTVYAVWGYDNNGNGTPDVEEGTYSLIYDANGGAFGKPGGASQAAVNDLSSDIAYKLWAKDPEVTDDTQPENEAKWPAFYNVSGDNNVVMIGWTAEKDSHRYKKGDKMPALIDEVTIKDKDVTVYAVWGYDNNGNGTPDVEENFYTLTYDANGGAFGDKTTAAATGLAAKDYPLWDKKAGTIPEDIPVDTEGTALLPTHAKANAPAGSLIAGEGTEVPVVMIGWTTEKPAKQGEIYASGEQLPTLVDSVTIKDADVTVYAVWGFDENGDGAADAQQIIITPADITIYEGGNGYDGIVDENGESAEGDAAQDEESLGDRNGLAEPGYYLVLPYALNEHFGGADVTDDLSGKLQLRYEQGSDKRNWDLKLYNEEPGANNQVPGDLNHDGVIDGEHYNVYKLVPVGENQHPVRLEVKMDDGSFVTTDAINFNIDSLFEEYNMRLYNTDGFATTGVTAYLRVNGDELVEEGGAWMPADEIIGENTVQGIARGYGKLTIRGASDASQVSEIAEAEPSAEVSQITAVADASTEYNVNDSDIPVVGQENGTVQLLDDAIVSDSDTNAMLEEAIMRAHSDIESDYTFDFHYLDLVDTANGHAYATLADGDEVTLFWPYPEGMDKNDTFYIAHFDGLDRNYDANSLNDDVLDDSLKMYTEDGSGDYKLEKTENGIKFTTSSFSPFALVYDNEGSGTIDPPPVDPGEPGDGDDNNPPALNTEDHFSYVVGYEDGMVKPQRNITRAEVSSIFYRLLEDEVRDDNTTNVSEFSDVSASDWYGTTVATLSKMGIVKGYEDGTFRPNAPITRAEFAAIATRFFEETGADYEPGTFTDVSGDEWFAGAIQDAVNLGLIGGYEDGTVRPNNNITRAEACAIVNRTLGRVPDADHLLPVDEMKTWPDNQPSDWFYADMQEATNGHEYEWIKEDGNKVEQWTKIMLDNDWEER